MPGPQSNEEMIAQWSGRVGEAWTQFQAETDAMLRPMSEALLGALAASEGERILDVGCGCGTTSLEIAKAVGERGAVTGVDVSGPMLARAREVGAGRPVTFLEADASVHAFPVGAFDAIASRFGVMFFAEPVGAFVNLRRALRPGGRIAFVAWAALGENPWARDPLAIAARHVPVPPPGTGYQPGPFGLSDETFVLELLDRAGFVGCTLEKIRRPLPMPAGLPAALAYFKRIGPVARLLAEADDTARQRVIGDLTAWIEQQAAHGAFAPEGSAWVATARTAQV